MDRIPTKQDIIDAHERIAEHIPRTPVMRSEALDRAADAGVHCKMECLMPDVGSFKIRGVMNALLSLSPQDRKRGVLTQSSGNHAQAFALVAKKMGIPATIVMPRNANAIKKRNVLEFGGRIVECEPGDGPREQMVLDVQRKTGAVTIHPFNDYRIIAGQATAAKELLEDVPDLDAIVVPVGGGGLLSGTALAAHYFSPQTKVIAGEPSGADDAYRSLYSGSIQGNPTVDTIADGLITKLGDKTFPIIQQHVDDIIRVDDEEISSAMRQLWERLRVTVEPSGAVAYAAVLKENSRFYRQNVGIILSGGNVDLDRIPFLQ
ncbi:MAG: Pyridoxal-5'-phosphate-dependent protein beta subunit [Candidatus Peregrinibacteria bacterium Greene1014_49]|nr:MAG: Pyridoxal-5'-phosphate-dependent protein beta subunit [Candidatus Peregrinibacteria bacterium Greene1014_49]